MFDLYSPSPNISGVWEQAEGAFPFHPISGFCPVDDSLDNIYSFPFQIVGQAIVKHAPNHHKQVVCSIQWSGGSDLEQGNPYSGNIIPIQNGEPVGVAFPEFPNHLLVT